VSEDLEQTNDSIQTDSDRSESRGNSSNHSQSPSPRNIVTAAVTTILPHYEPLPLVKFLLLTFACSVPAILYIIGFTKMGYGLQVSKFLSTRLEPHAGMIGLGLAGFSSLLYLLDAKYWKSSIGKCMRRTLYGFVVLGTSTLLLAISRDHPYGPISIYYVLTTLWLVSVHNIFFSNTPTRKYVTWLSGPLFCTSILIFLAWLIWTFLSDENEFTSPIKLIDASTIGCKPDFTNREFCSGTNKGDVCFSLIRPVSVLYPDGCDTSCRDVFSSCIKPFILWIGPFLTSAGLLFLSFFTTFIGGRVSAEEEIVKFTKIWVFLLFGLWVAASLAGVGAGLTFALAAITLAAFVASGIFVATSYERIEREEQIKILWDNIVEKYGSYLNGARGLLVVTCTPVAIVYIFISGIKQRIRSLMCLECSQPPQSTRDLAEPKTCMSGLTTIESRKAVSEFRSWDRVAVYSWALFWGTGFMVFSVLVSRFTVLFLSWLIEETRDFSLGVVTAIMIGVGLLMFLLPPVPGAPIYLAMGIIIIPVGRDTLGLVLSIVYAIGVSLFLKLLATALQQKMIGGLLRNHIGVRQLVGVNSTFIRGTKLLLNKPGFSVAKVSILVGGPDWPTSVLCGIIGLPLLPILIGTLPIMALIVPTVLAGSFTFLESEEDENGIPSFPKAGVWASLFTAIAALVLFGSSLLAAKNIEQTISTRGDELEQIPIDEEVKIKEDEEESFRKAYVEVSNWEEVPLVLKIILSISVACMIASCYIVQLFQLDSFRPYELTDTIDEELSGNWKNIVRPLGWISILLFTTSLFLFNIFYIWAKNKAITISNEPDNTSADGGGDGDGDGGELIYRT